MHHAWLPWLVALLAASASSGPQDPPQPIELKLAPYVGPLRTVSARVGDADVPFLFDTGGGATVVTPQLLQQLGGEPFGRGTGFRHDGTRVDGRRGGPVTLAFGAFCYDGEVGVLDLDAFLQGLPKVGGIASLHTFAKHAITLDLGANRLVVETPASLAERTRGAKELEVRVARPGAGAGLDLFVAIAGKHGPQWFELDCGNTGPVLVAPHAWSELGLDGSPAAAPTKGTLDVRGFGKVTCEVAAKEMIYDGVLDAAFCGRLLLTLDLPTARAWARTK
jgi:hypothetical protein